MKINEERLNEWKLLVDERKRRGIKVDEFCKEKSITVPQFYYYQKQVNKNQQTQNHNASPAIQPIKIVNSTSRENDVIRFILPNSMQCVLPRDMSFREIKGILEIVMIC